LSKARRKFDDQVFNVQLVLLSRATGSVSSGDFSSLAAKRAKLQATILLPLETSKVARGNAVDLIPNLITKALLRLTQLIIVAAELTN